MKIEWNCAGSQVAMHGDALAFTFCHQRMPNPNSFFTNIYKNWVFKKIWHGLLFRLIFTSDSVRQEWKCSFISRRARKER